MITPPVVRPSFATWQHLHGIPVWAAQPQHADHYSLMQRDFIVRMSYGLGLVTEEMLKISAGYRAARAEIEAFEQAMGYTVEQSFKSLSKALRGEL